MAAVIALFANTDITSTTADAGRVVNSHQQDWMSVGVHASAVTGDNPTAEFRLQWSYDNVVWAEPNPGDIIGTLAAPGTLVQRFDVKAPYWRLAVTVGGTDPSFTCTANALI